jgi:hypothetical protein
MGALAYLDFCYLKHQIEAILRSPGRLAMWLPYAVMIAVLGIRRATLTTSTAPGGLELSTIEEPLFATLAAGTYLVAFGMVAGLAATGRFAAFRSRAEAIAIANAGISSLAVALWLQVRRFVGSWPRWILTILYLFAFAAPHGAAGPSSHVTIATLVAFSALAMVELPVFLASRRRFGGFVAPLGWGLALVGAAYALLAAFGPQSWARGVAFAHFDPGRWLLAIVAGSGPALALAAAVPPALAALAIVLAADAMPELYQATAQTFARRKRGAHRPARFRAHAVRAAAIPAGSLAILWKDWVTLRRRPGGLRLWALQFVLWAAAGIAIDYDILVLGDLGIATALCSLGLIAALSLVLTASVTIADDLSKPLWWLGRDALSARIAMWTFARAWRGGTSFAMLPLAVGVGTGDLTFALAGTLGALVAWWTLGALGVALYAAFPGRVDERGPVVLLRLLGFGLLLSPAVAAGAVSETLTNAPALAVCLAAAVLAAEATGAIAFAAWRISENGAGIAALERAG